MDEQVEKSFDEFDLDKLNDEDRAAVAEAAEKAGVPVEELMKHAVSRGKEAWEAVDTVRNSLNRLPYIHVVDPATVVGCWTVAINLVEQDVAADLIAAAKDNDIDLEADLEAYHGLFRRISGLAAGLVQSRAAQVMSQQEAEERRTRGNYI